MLVSRRSRKLLLVINFYKSWHFEWLLFFYQETLYIQLYSIEKKLNVSLKPFVSPIIFLKQLLFFFFQKRNMQKFRIIFRYQYKLSRKDQISKRKKKKYVYRFQRLLQFWLKISIFLSPPVYGTIYPENEILSYRDLIQSRMKYGNNVIIGTKRSRGAQLV